MLFFFSLIFWLGHVHVIVYVICVRLVGKREIEEVGFGIYNVNDHLSSPFKKKSKVLERSSIEW